MPISTRLWYLVYAKPRQERVAVENLERQGFETYLPLIRQRRRRQGRYAGSVEPMFPRYLFVRLDMERDNWAPIRSTLGVSHLVRFGAALAQVPGELVTLLRSREDRGGVQDAPAPDFRSGAGVRIVEGPLAGYEGIFDAVSGRDRVTVLLDICGRQAAVELRPDHLESLS